MRDPRLARTAGTLALAAAALFACTPASEIDDDGWQLALEPLAIEGELREITDLAFFPDSSEFLALGRTGLVHHYGLGERGASLLGSFQLPGVQASWDCGLIGAAFDPAFAENRFVFFSTCLTGRAAGVLRVTHRGDYRAIEASTREILRLQAPEGRGMLHRIGSLGFEPDGVLWAMVGDMTSPEDAQDVRNELGSIVRLVPSRDPERGGYEVPPGNAFDPGGPQSPLVYAWGFRMPWRGLRDARGRFWLGDVGGTHGREGYEEVDVVMRAGQNFGWPREIGPASEGADAAQLEPPLVYWDRSDDHAFIREDPGADLDWLREHRVRVAWVGGPYLRDGVDRYQGRLFDRVLFGDICAGFVRAIGLDEAGAIVFHRHVGHLPFLSGLDRAPDGHLYATTMGGCTTDAAAAPGGFHRVRLTWPEAEAPGG